MCLCVYLCGAVWTLVRGKPAGLGFGGITVPCISIPWGGFAHARPKVCRVVLLGGCFSCARACKIYFAVCSVACELSTFNFFLFSFIKFGLESFIVGETDNKMSQWNYQAKHQNFKMGRSLSPILLLTTRGRPTWLGLTLIGVTFLTRHANCLKSHFASYLLMLHGRRHHW